jgi:hypothetical protein
MYNYRITGALPMSRAINEPNDRRLHKVAIPRLDGFTYLSISFFLFAFNAFELIITTDLADILGIKDDLIGDERIKSKTCYMSVNLEYIETSCISINI